MLLFVEFDASRKKINCAAEEVIDEVRQKFSIPMSHRVILQEKDEDMWFDVDDIALLEDRASLKVVVARKDRFLDTSSEIDTTANSSIADLDTSTNTSNITDSMDANLENEPPATEPPATEPPATEPPATEPPANVDPVQNPWPNTFNIRSDQFGRHLRRQLEEKIKLGKRMRSLLFTSIYEEAVSYRGGYHPDKNMYNQMVEALLAAYPYLRGRASFTDSSTYWKTKLSNYFRNTRKRGDREVPVVAARIARGNRGNRTQQYKDPSANPWGIKHFLPDRCEKEDDVSIKNHMAVLNRESRLAPQMRDNELVRLSMDKTFPERRRFIVDTIRSIDDIHDEYPLLFNFKQIQCEFKRLTDVDLVTIFTTSIGKYATALVNFTKQKKEPNLVTRLREHMTRAEIDSRKEYYKTATALTVIPQQLREDLMLLFNDSDDERSYPTLKVVDGAPTDHDVVIQIVVEGRTVLECEDLLTAFGALLPVYYVLNIAYPEALQATLLFFQKALLGLNDGMRNTKVSNLLTKLLV